MLVVAIVPRPTQGAQFVLSWSYPDTYGQGIEGFVFAQNSTGSWVTVDNTHASQYSAYKPWNETNEFRYEYTFLRLEIWVYLNASLVGIDDPDDAYLFQRVNMTLYNSTNTLWSKPNVTSIVAVDNGNNMYWCEFRDVINYEFSYGETYRVVVTYEVYY
jgi:hypothetical protein